MGSAKSLDWSNVECWRCDEIGDMMLRYPRPKWTVFEGFKMRVQCHSDAVAGSQAGTYVVATAWALHEVAVECDSPKLDVTA